MQLELFSPDRMLVGEGWARVEALDLEGARAAFAEVVDRWPEADDAREALAAVERALTVLGGPREGDAHRRARSLWAALGRLATRGAEGRVRRALAAGVVAALEELGGGDPQGGPSVGEALLAAGRVEAALDRLRRAVKGPMVPARLLRAAGDAAWALGHEREARAHWLRWLLAGGAEAGGEAPRLPDAELEALLRREGVDAAPAAAWLEGLTWLLPGEHLPRRDSPGLEVHRLLAAAEAARRAGDLDAAVRHRERLRELAPGVLDRYMARLGGSG